jgi:hypothetical protein
MFAARRLGVGVGRRVRSMSSSSSSVKVGFANHVFDRSLPRPTKNLSLQLQHAVERLDIAFAEKLHADSRAKNAELDLQTAEIRMQEATKEWAEAHLAVFESAAAATST